MKTRPDIVAEKLKCDLENYLTSNQDLKVNDSFGITFQVRSISSPLLLRLLSRAYLAVNYWPSSISITLHFTGHVRGEAQTQDEKIWLATCEG